MGDMQIGEDIMEIGEIPEFQEGRIALLTAETIGNGIYLNNYRYS
jgi:hypothetical protein